MNKKTKGILNKFKSLKKSWKIAIVLGFLFMVITGTAVCATCGNQDEVPAKAAEE
jgi:hypothetical protein